MKYLLREVKFKRWVNIDKQNLKKFPSDPLSDLRTGSNMLSSFLVENETDVKDVVIGFFTNRRPDNFEFFLIPPEFVDNSDFGVQITDGQTRYEKANNKHRDINIRTAINLIKFAYSCNRDFKRDSLPKKQVISIIEDAIKRNIVSPSIFSWKKTP